MARKAKAPAARTVEALRHRREEATRKNIRLLRRIYG